MNETLNGVGYETCTVHVLTNHFKPFLIIISAVNVPNTLCN